MTMRVPHSTPRSPTMQPRSHVPSHLACSETPFRAKPRQLWGTTVSFTFRAGASERAVDASGRRVALSPRFRPARVRGSRGTVTARARGGARDGFGFAWRRGGCCQRSVAGVADSPPVRSRPRAETRPPQWRPGGAGSRRRRSPGGAGRRPAPMTRWRRWQAGADDPPTRVAGPTMPASRRASQPATGRPTARPSQRARSQSERHHPPATMQNAANLRAPRRKGNISIPPMLMRAWRGSNGELCCEIHRPRPSRVIWGASAHARAV